jgi:hypothetical protein
MPTSGNLAKAFGWRFKDVKSNVKQLELNIFATPFNVEPADGPDGLLHEVIELKARYNNFPL